MKSLRDEIPLRGKKDAADLISYKLAWISSAKADFIVRSTISFIINGLRRDQTAIIQNDLQSNINILNQTQGGKNVNQRIHS